MKVKVRVGKVLGESHNAILEEAQNRSYKQIKNSLELMALGFARNLSGLMEASGLTVTSVRVKVVEKSEPTIDELRSNFDFEVTIDGEPYERPAARDD